MLLGVEPKESWWDEEPISLGRFGILRRRQIYPYLTEDLYHAVRLWKDYRRFGLPHGKGYMDESDEYISLINSFEDTYEEAVNDIRRKAAGGK